MGGVAGHLAHLYDNRDLTYNKMAEILHKAANGELVGTEKTDGYNIYLGFVDGKPRAARNKGDMAKGGMTMEDLANRKFKGGEKSKKAYVTAFQAYEKALNSLSDEEKIQIFGPSGEIFYNTEIQGPIAPNVVNYDENILSIHHMGHKRYNKETNMLEMVETQEQAQLLNDLVDRFEEATAKEPFSVRKTAFLDLNRITDEEFVQNILNRIEQTGFSGAMTLNDFLEAKLFPMIEKDLPQLDQNRHQLLVDRILGKEGAPTTPQITKGMSREEKEKVSQYKKGAKFILKKLIEPIEMAIHDFTVELLRGLKSAYILDNKAEINRLKKETEGAIRAIQSYEGEGKEAAHSILARQLEKLKHHDNIDTVVEGFVFQHDGQLYKFTGNFAPMNQLLGLFRYGRGKVPHMVKEALEDQNEANYDKEIVAILPGKFKPAHRGHLDMIKHYLQHADRVVVLISPKDKDGITADISERLLQLYIKDAGLQNVDIEISQYPSPVQAAMEYGNSPEMEGTKIILGASSKGGDAAERFAGDVQKYTVGAEVLNPLDYAYDPVGDVISATDFRSAIKNNEDIDRFIPAASKDKAAAIVDMVKEKIQENTQTFLGIFRGLVDETLEEISKAGKERVSKKIPVLKDEGYPTDQAIAIAHSMEEKGKLEETEEKIYFPAKYLKTTNNEYVKEPKWREFTQKSEKEKRDWATTISLEEPVEVTVYVDGTFGFNDGHHRVMAGKILDKEIPINIAQRQMVVKYPEAWEKWKEVIVGGKRDPKTINPEGYLIKTAANIDYLTKDKEEIEEISGVGAVAGYSLPLGAKPKRQKQKRKIGEEEVNEVLNYLLQKLGV